MSIDLNTLSLAELKQLQKDVEKAIASYEAREKARARTAAEEVARQFGFNLSDLVGAPAEKARRGPVAAKYRHPENSAITWSGRGRQPRWFAAAIAAGKSPEDMAV